MAIKRILHIIGKMDRAGAETMVMNLYRTINRDQFQFDFVVFSGKKGDYDEEIESLGGNIYSILETNPIKRMLALKKLLLKHSEYKIVHCHTLFSNAFHLLAAKMAKVPNRISHSHSTSDQSKSKLVSTIYQNLSRKLIKKFTTSYIGCGVAAAQFLFPQQKEVLFLPNAVDINHFVQIGSTEKNYINNEFKLTNGCFKIIQVGRLNEVKNHLFSIKIAKELKKKGINFKMFFVGDGTLRDTLIQEIEKVNLNDDVLLLGVRSDIPQLMAGADVMLMPSLHEGFPVVLVESQSVGLPSLIADTISREVDLNVDLVVFESLRAEITDWVDKFVLLKNKQKIGVESRLEQLEEQGFDIHSSAKLLTNLYNSMN